jgi:hypothetical protein
MRVYVVGALLAATAPAAADCRPPADPAQAQYIVGYGSLMQEESRRLASPHAGPVHAVEVRGFRRGWFARGRGPGLATTFLGVVEDRKARLNAVLYRVDIAELAATDRREASYCRLAVRASDILVLDGADGSGPAAERWIYVSAPARVAAPSGEYPIVQSYVDLFVSGCLEQEERFSLAGFAARCLATTSGWSGHWVNDRIYPRRPFVFQPRARQIDELLARELPRYFARIRLEGNGRLEGSRQNP